MQFVDTFTPLPVPFLPMIILIALVLAFVAGWAGRRRLAIALALLALAASAWAVIWSMTDPREPILLPGHLRGSGDVTFVVLSTPVFLMTVGAVIALVLLLIRKRR